MASFAAHQQCSSQPPPARWHPSCSHSTMAVVYHESYACDICGRSPPLGCLYRCVVDRDPLILKHHARGSPVAFDSLGRRFASEMCLGKSGPDARSHELNFFDEISPEQLSSYTQSQLAVVLSQRENVHRVIAEERSQVNHPVRNSAKMKYPDDRRPWMPSEKYECQAKVCHRCHRLGREKSWVSLDAVLKGDVMPNVATGFSFSYMGSRPVADASIVRAIGCRAVPLPPGHPARPSESKPFQRTNTDSDDESCCSTCAPSSLSSLSADNSWMAEPHRAIANTSAPVLGQAATALAIATPYLATAPRSMSPRFGELHVNDFITEFEYSEYTLACCTPLPEVDSDEESSLAALEQAAAGSLSDGEARVYRASLMSGTASR